jgi:transcriptional regulator with XRE-family HTH domain
MKPVEFDPNYSDLMLAIGERIKDLRKEKNISYEKMAEKIGISRNSYNAIELGKTNFQFLTLLRILKYHNISIFQFIDSVKR